MLNAGSLLCSPGPEPQTYLEGSQLTLDSRAGRPRRSRRQRRQRQGNAIKIKLHRK